MDSEAPAAPEQEILRLYTPRELADASGLHIESIKRLTRDGQIEFVNVAQVGDRNQYRYTAAQFRAFIERRTKTKP